MSILDIADTHPIFSTGNVANLILVLEGLRNVAFIDFTDGEPIMEDIPKIRRDIGKYGLKTHPLDYCPCDEMCRCVSIPVTLPSYDKSGKMSDNLGYLYPYDKKLDGPSNKACIKWMVNGDLIYRETCRRIVFSKEMIERDILDLYQKYDRCLDKYGLCFHVRLSE